MNIETAVKSVADKFWYLADLPAFLNLWDYWFVMPEHDNKLSGDCEDFTLTCFWYYADKNLWRFLWNLLVTHRYKMYRVMTTNNEPHLIGSVDGLWFDNWTLSAIPKSDFFEVTKHRVQWQVISLFMILPLVIGYCVRNRYKGQYGR